MTRRDALIMGDLRAIIYLRLSDFRDEDDGTFTAREDELTELAGAIGARVIRVATENDLNAAGRPRGASAYKTPKRVETSTGLVTFRTNRPEFARVVLELQQGVANVLIIGDESRATRNHRDALDLLDAFRVAGASAVAPDDEGQPHWILTRGGTRAEVSAFMDRVEAARKFSEDIGRKVAKGRRRWAGKSYQGGRRPFGFRVAEGTKEHARNLAHDVREAAEIENAAWHLEHGVSLKAVMRSLNDRGVSTVTGAPWSTRTIRDMLLKPAVAGLQLRGGELVAAPWEPILDRGRWERLGELLRDPHRRTSTANEPRWLVSCFATCGVCGHTLKVGGAGRGRSPAYVGSVCGHVRRNAAAVDEAVGLAVVEVLSSPEAAWLLRPRPRATDVDHATLTAELAKVRARRSALTRQLAAGLITEDDLAAGAEVIRGQESALMAQLTATGDVDPLPEFRGTLDAADVWAGLPLARQRAVVQALFGSIVVMRSGKTGRVFDPELIKITPRPEIAAVAA